MNFDGTTAIILGLTSIIGFITWIWLIILAFKESVSWGLIVLIAPFLLGIIAFLVVGTSMISGGGSFFYYVMTIITLLPFIFFGLNHFSRAKIPLILFIISNLVSVHYSSQMMQSLGMNEMMAIQQDLRSGKISQEDAQARMLAWAEKLEQSGMLSEADKQNLQTMRDLMEKSGKNDFAEDRRLAPKVGERSAADNYDPREEARKREAEAQRRLQAKLAEREKDKSRFTVTKKPVSKFTTIKYAELKNYLGQDIQIIHRNGITHSGTLARILSYQDKIILSKEIGTGHADYALHRADIKTILVRK